MRRDWARAFVFCVCSLVILGTRPLVGATHFDDRG
jgi:hypothetical protein